MKKGIFIKSVSFLLFFLFLISLYLGFYLFPSLKKINMLKRGIKQYTIKIENAKIEKTIFIKNDNREDLLFKECESEFLKRLEEWKNDKITFRDALRNRGEKAGVSRLRISSESGENIFSFSPGSELIKQKNIDMTFIAGLRYGGEFIRVLPLSGQYLLITNISAVRTGGYYNFTVNTKHLYIGEVETDKTKPSSLRKGDLLDMNSPLLKRPVYLSSQKIRRGTGK